MNYFDTFFERLSTVATVGPLAMPIWIAGLFFILAILRGPLVGLFFKAFRVSDRTVETALRERVDIPLQFLFLTMALMPFTFLVARPLGTLLVAAAHVAAIGLLFHIIIQTIDLSVFSWYVTHKQANVSRVVRTTVLCILYLIAAMLLLDWGMGVSILPLLATSTVLAALIGLALQDTLKNAFAGLNMSLENSFEEGDWVSFRLDATEQWFGQIAEIGWRTTKIKTLNNNYAVIPNSKFTNHELINFNKPTAIHARTLEIPVALQLDPESVKLGLVKCAAACEGVLDDPPPTAMPLSITTDHVVYQVRFWLADIERREAVSGAVLQQVWKELRDLQPAQ